MDISAIRDPERRFACGFAPADRRAAIMACWALDEALGAILQRNRDPMIAQFRLTWWHEALSALDRAPPPPEPVLNALARTVIPKGLSGAALAAMVDGWERLIDADPLSNAALMAFAEARGGRLFAAIGALFGQQVPPSAGPGWALIDLARHSSESDLALRCRTLAGPLLDAAMANRWPRQTRCIGMLIASARGDVPCRARLPRSFYARSWAMQLHAITGK